jgi:hypothetical protein
MNKPQDVAQKGLEFELYLAKVSNVELIKEGDFKPLSQCSEYELRIRKVIKRVIEQVLRLERNPSTNYLTPDYLPRGYIPNDTIARELETRAQREIGNCRLGYIPISSRDEKIMFSRIIAFDNFSLSQTSELVDKIYSLNISNAINRNFLGELRPLCLTRDPYKHKKVIKDRLSEHQQAY